MTAFRYEAAEDSGRIRTGVVDADSPRLDDLDEYREWARAVRYLRGHPPLPKQYGG